MFPARRRSDAGWLTLGLVLIPLIASSQTAPAPPDTAQSPGPRQVCREDAERLCPEARGAERRRCLASHADEVSKPCREQLGRRAENARRMAERIRESCGEDVKKHCALVVGPQVIQCLMKVSDPLDPACRDLLPRRAGP